jgi:porphobilinogen synthase
MNPTQRREAFLETRQDIREMADIVMVKPALFYLDIVRDLRNEISVPLAVYQVSGEYSMLKLAADRKLASEKEIFIESFIAMRRAGADIIISYAAKEVLRFLS